MKNFLSKQHLVPLLIFLIIDLLFFYPVIFSDQVFFFGDTLTQRVPSMVYWRQRLLQGELPLWNPYIFAGLPHLADLSTNTLSPFNLAYLLIPNPLRTLSILALFEVFLSSVFMYLFLFRFFKPTPALFGAIAFTYSGTTLAAINDINSLQGIILIPLVLLTVHKFVLHPSQQNLLLIPLALTFQFISGHPQYSYYTWLLTACYLFIFLPRPLIKKATSTIAIFSLFFCLSAVQLLPFLELSQQTYRPDNLEFSSQNSLQLLDLPHFIFADIYGNWRSGTSWGPNSPMETGRANSEGFLGITTLFLALIALIKAKSKPTRFFFAVSFFSLVLAFGPSTPLFTLSRSIFPFFSKFRSPIRILSLYTLSVSFLAAAGLNYLNHHAQPKS